MRKFTDLQINLFGESISNVKLDLNSRDEIPKLLFGLQTIYNNTMLRNKVGLLLKEILPDNIDTKTGRKGMDLWKILVLGTLRLNCNWDFDKTHEIANNHMKIRAMLGHVKYDEKKYGLQTINDNVQLLTPDILDKINVLVVAEGHALLGVSSEELKARCDSFVAETNVHYPTDINVLFDTIRKIITIVACVCDGLGITEWRQLDHNMKKIKKLFNTARRLNYSTSQNEEVQAKREQLIINAHNLYIEIIESYIKRAECSMSIIRTMVVPQTVLLRFIEVDAYIVHAKRQIDQIQRRIINGEKIPHDEKVFSIFEEHTEWIKKGKAGVKQELGLRVSILEDQFGFILHHKVMERQTDEKVTVSMVLEAKSKFKMLNSCSFDKGYYTPENKVKLKEIIKNVTLPKKGKLSKKDKVEEHSEEFIRARHQHSAVESAINALENHGLDRCPDRGLHGFKRYVSLAVLARNIQIIGNIVQQKEKRRQEKLLKAA